MELSKADQDLHNELVQSLLRDLNGNGYKIISADLPGYPVPAKLKNSVPDVLAKDKNGRYVICEVETCNSVDTEHAKAQLTDFTTYDARVVLLVPGDCKRLAKQALEKWGFDRKVELW